MPADIVPSQALSLHFTDWACSLVHDIGADEWVLEFDDTDIPSLLLESPEQPFAPVEVVTVKEVLTAELFAELKAWLLRERAVWAQEIQNEDALLGVGSML
jgi:hypothetical protein